MGSSRIPKIRKKESQVYLIAIAWDIKKEKVRQEEYISSGSSNSSIWDKLNFEKAKTLKLSYLDIPLPKRGITER